MYLLPKVCVRVRAPARANGRTDKYSKSDQKVELNTITSFLITVKSTSVLAL